MAQQSYSAESDSPQFAVPEAYRIPVSDYRARMLDIPPSRMFLINDTLQLYRQKAGAEAPTYDASQGDGGKSLPGVPTEILERAFELQLRQGTSYDKPWGTPLFRQAAAEDYWKLDAASGWGPENIVFCQGGRDGLLKIYSAITSVHRGRVGDALVVSRVPWVSYTWGPYSIGLNVLLAPGDPAQGWRYTPDSIRSSAEFARREGRDVAGLLITSPDNPTGRTLPVEEQILLAHTALDSGYPYVIFDWMYHWVTDHGPSDINAVLQAFSNSQRERLIFLDGITKSLGGSNIRSAHILAGKAIVKHITSQASHGVVPSFFAQAVAIAAYQMGFDRAAASIIEPTGQSRKVLRAALAKENVPFVMGDGYYAFIDCTRYIEAGGLHNSEALLQHLGANYGVVVVPGMYFSDAGLNWVRFSYALPPEVTLGAAARLFEGLNALR
ncbi:MAG: pyridoxal phosphate-dependent aminotransferase [Anaerolineae bacterium]|nr:pyridoxal phosphate-dependent aminotransferase [Anaerolineae bacterium]